MIAQYPIGGNDTGYDYLRVDALTRRVFVAHANRVEVLNVDTGEKVGEITGMHGVHGIELIPELGKGYTSNGLDRTDRKSTRLNSSHVKISYAVFCLKKKKQWLSKRRICLERATPLRRCPRCPAASCRRS